MGRDRFRRGRDRAGRRSGRRSRSRRPRESMAPGRVLRALAWGVAWLAAGAGCGSAEPADPLHRRPNVLWVIRKHFQDERTRRLLIRR